MSDSGREHFDIRRQRNDVEIVFFFTALVQKFYQVRTTPYEAVYDKNHKLVETFAKIPEIGDLVKAVK